jgi:hypothetical protein
MQAYLIASHFVYQEVQVEVWQGLAMRENKFVGVNEDPAFLGLYSSHLECGGSKSTNQGTAYNLTEKAQMLAQIPLANLKNWMKLPEGHFAMGCQ